MIYQLKFNGQSYKYKSIKHLIQNNHFYFKKTKPYMEHQEINIFLYQKLEKILSNQVFSAKKKDSPSRKVQFAIKICKKNYEQKMFIEEGHIHKKLPNSPYLIKYIDSKKDILIKSKNQKQKKVIYHIFEYYENGTLSNYINLDKNILVK